MTTKSFVCRAFGLTALSICIASASLAAPKDPSPAKLSSVPSKAGTTPAMGSPAPVTEKAPGTVLYVPGSYQNYKPGNAPQIGAVPGSTGTFEGYVHVTGDGIQGFKFTDSPDWDHTNYGEGGHGMLSKDGHAADLTVPGAGYYEMTVDLNKNTWSATKTTWSVIGNATSGDWDKDTPMTYDPDKQVWTVTLPMKAAGSFKFRANNAWKIDFGLNVDGHLQYSDNPFLGYNANVKDLTVPDDGTYTITLDLHRPGDYTYKIDVK